MKKVLVLAPLLVCLFLTSCGSYQVDLLDYVIVEFSGSDGIGTAKVVFDDEGLKYNLENNSKKASSVVVKSIVDSVSISLDKEKELSNEDSVNITLTWNDELANDYSFNFKGEPKSFIVSNLKERIQVDLFKDIEVYLDGVSPNGRVVIQNNSSDDIIKKVIYSSSEYNVGNGDTVTIKASYYNIGFNTDDHIILESEKEFTISSADEYTKTFEEIDAQALEKLKTQAEDILTTRFSEAKNYIYAVHNTYSTYRFDVDSIDIISTELKDSYFLSYKDGLSSTYIRDNNMVYLIYEMKVNDAKLSEEIIIYPIVSCKNFINRNTGETYFELTDVSYYKSFKDLDSIKADLIDSNKAKYDYEEISL